MAATTARASISAAALEEHRAHGPPGLEADDVAGQHQLGAEPGHLGQGPVGEVGAAQAAWEAEVVLDRGALAGLPSRRLALDDDGAQTLRRGVHAGGQPGRSAADDADVVERPLGGGVQAERAGDLQRRGRPQGLAVRHQHERQVGRAAPARGARAGRPRRPARRRTSGRGRGCGSGTVLISWLRSDHRCPTTRTSEVCSGCPCRQSSSRSSTTG